MYDANLCFTLTVYSIKKPPPKMKYRDNSLGLNVKEGIRLAFFSSFFQSFFWVELQVFYSSFGQLLKQTNLKSDL